MAVGTRRTWLGVTQCPAYVRSRPRERLELEGAEKPHLQKARLELDNPATARNVTVVSYIPVSFSFSFSFYFMFFLKRKLIRMELEKPLRQES